MIPPYYVALNFDILPLPTYTIASNGYRNRLSPTFSNSWPRHLYAGGHNNETRSFYLLTPDVFAFFLSSLATLRLTDPSLYTSLTSWDSPFPFHTVEGLAYSYFTPRELERAYACKGSLPCKPRPILKRAAVPQIAYVHRPKLIRRYDHRIYHGLKPDTHHWLGEQPDLRIIRRKSILPNPRIRLPRKPISEI